MILPSNKQSGGGANSSKPAVTKTQFNNVRVTLCLRLCYIAPFAHTYCNQGAVVAVVIIDIILAVSLLHKLLLHCSSPL